MSHFPIFQLYLMDVASRLESCSTAIIQTQHLQRQNPAHRQVNVHLLLRLRSIAIDNRSLFRCRLRHVCSNPISTRALRGRGICIVLPARGQHCCVIVVAPCFLIRRLNSVCVCGRCDLLALSGVGVGSLRLFNLKVNEVKNVNISLSM
jgi:hypothetical protein